MTRKSFLSHFYAKFTLINSISYDPENGSKCCLKTLKNGQNGAQNGPENPENGTKKWLDTLINCKILNTSSGLIDILGC